MLNEGDAEIINLYSEPKLNKPALVAAWPGIGNVALGAVNYLKDTLKAKEFAEINPLSFYDLNGVLIEDNLIQQPSFPQSKFYYWTRGKSGPDLIFFVGDAQPSSQSYEYANIVLDLAQRFGVKHVYTFAAALISHFSDNPRVWGAATDKRLIKELEGRGLVLKSDFYVAGMNGLLLSVARQRRMKGTCLLGETPRYLGEVGNPAASYAVLKILTEILKLKIDMTELEEMAKQARQEIESIVKESRREFIDRFTVPLWERPEEEEKG